MTPRRTCKGCGDVLPLEREAEHCTECQHYRTAKYAPAPTRGARKRCGACGELGHNRRSCSHPTALDMVNP